MEVASAWRSVCDTTAMPLDLLLLPFLDDDEDDFRIRILLGELGFPFLLPVLLLLLLDLLLEDDDLSLDDLLPPNLAALAAASAASRSRFSMPLVAVLRRMLRRHPRSAVAASLM